MSIEYAVFVVVIATTIWLTYDASTNKIPITRKPYSLNNGALAWCLSAVLVWIATFPYYLVRRSQVLRERHSPATPASLTGQDIESQLSMFAGLKERGLISQSDYDQKKRQLLGIADSPQPVAPPAPTARQVDDSVTPCPSCGKQLWVSTLKHGDNYCPHCFEKFAVD